MDIIFAHTNTCALPTPNGRTGLISLLQACYTRVCGRIRAYQDDTPDAFEPYDIGQETTIDGSYVAGVRWHSMTTHLDICSWISNLVVLILSVLVMLQLILPSHHLWVETISVNQDGNIFYPDLI